MYRVAQLVFVLVQFHVTHTYSYVGRRNSNLWRSNQVCVVWDILNQNSEANDVIGYSLNTTCRSCLGIPSMVLALLWCTTMLINVLVYQMGTSVPIWNAPRNGSKIYRVKYFKYILTIAYKKNVRCATVIFHMYDTYIFHWIIWLKSAQHTYKRRYCSCNTVVLSTFYIKQFSAIAKENVAWKQGAHKLALAMSLFVVLVYPISFEVLASELSNLTGNFVHDSYVQTFLRVCALFCNEAYPHRGYV